MFRLKLNRYIITPIPLLTSNLVFNDEYKYPKNHKTGEHKMLLFGETGCGKSTFINTVTNYFKGGNINNLHVSIPTKYLKQTEKQYKHSEKNVLDTSKSQTKDAITYTFNNNNKKTTFKIIDTCGINDSEGIEQDDENIETILNACIGTDELSTVVLIINGTNARITNNIKNLITRFNGVMPDAIFDNIIVIFTMCREETCNFHSLENLGIKPKNIYYMNNSAFSTDLKKIKDKSILNIEWIDSMKTIENIMNCVADQTKILTKEFNKIKKCRDKIKTLLHESKINVLNLQNIIENYEIAKNEAEKNKMNMEQFKNYTVKKTIQKQQFVEVDYHSTICSVCNTVCHSHCSLNKETEIGGSGLVGCACLDSNGNCTHCEGKCNWKHHYHGNKDFQLVNVTIDEEVEELKTKYLAYKNTFDEFELKLTQDEIIKKSVEQEINNNLNKIKSYVYCLKKVCKNYNIVDELTELIYQLEQENILLKSVDAKITSKKYIDGVKSICDEFKTLNINTIELNNLDADILKEFNDLDK